MTTMASDPYVALGISTTASLAEIRSAHRKLVLKCHPDKVQDPALKAIKQDEFQKVQQAYELLSDDTRRQQYDLEQELAKMRRERGPVPNGRSGASTVFDYEVREAAPRTNTYSSQPQSQSQPQPREPVYARTQSSRSEEDHLGSRSYGMEYAQEKMDARAKKTRSYEEPLPRTVRRETSSKETREDERRRERREAEESAKTREKAAKDVRRREKERDAKLRDKEIKSERRGKEDRHRTKAYVADVSSDSEEVRDRKAERRRAEEDRLRRERFEDESRAKAAEKSRRKKEVEEETERTRKSKTHSSNAVQYILAAKSKSRKSAEATDPDDLDFRPKLSRRAETFQEAYNPPKHSAYDYDDEVRRSSAQRAPRRASEQAPEYAARSRDPPREATRDIPLRPAARERKNSYEGPSKPVIVEAAPPNLGRAPGMPMHSSSPANLENMVPKPSRSRTMPATYSQPPVSAPPPPMMRSSTFTQGDRREPKPPPRASGSRLKSQMNYTDSESDSDQHQTYAPRAASPPRRREAMPETRTSYKISKDGAVPKYTREHRSALREEDEYDRERSRSRDADRPSRRGAAERPPLVRSGGINRQSSSTRAPNSYYEDSSSTPIIKEVRPKPPAREGSQMRSGGNYFPENITYANYEPVSYAQGYSPVRRTAEPQQWEGPATSYSYPSRRETRV